MKRRRRKRPEDELSDEGTERGRGIGKERIVKRKCREKEK